jgi:uncharacterized protein (DUF2252 family)
MDLLEKHFESEQGCAPNLIRLKRAKMASNILDFYRGSAGIFYALWAGSKRGAPPVGWITGDAHWENVGSYKGKNHVAYFDFTDFDDACLAPLDFDLGRATTCLYLLGLGGLAAPFLAAYRKSLAAGKPYHIECEVARGTVARLLRRVKARSQRKFIKERSHHGRLIIDGKQTYRLSRREKDEASRIFRRWAATSKHPAFFALRDICGSYAGTGNLGHRRYLALIAGRSAAHLIDMKEAIPSAASEFTSIIQPHWINDAERIAEIQRIVQYVPIARLGWTRASKTSFVISEFQPAEDRVDSLSLSKKEYRDFVKQWGKLMAWSHLRGGGWKGAMTTSGLIASASKLDRARQRLLLRRSSAVATRLKGLFESFREIVVPCEKKES